MFVVSPFDTCVHVSVSECGWMSPFLNLVLQAAGSKRKRAAAEVSAAGDAEESGQSGGLSDEAESSEEGTSGVKPKPASAKKRANPRKSSNPTRSAIDEGSTGSDAKKVRLQAQRLEAGKGQEQDRTCPLGVTSTLPSATGSEKKDSEAQLCCLQPVVLGGLFGGDGSSRISSQ